MNIAVTIQGVTPLLMNRFTEDNELAVSSSVRKVNIGQKPSPREQAEKKAYTNSSGELCVPGPNIFASIIQAGTFHKVGKSKITTTKSSLIPAGMAIPEVDCSLGTKDFEVDSRSVVIPSTGGRIMAHRPRLDEWQLSFTLEVDENMFDEQTARVLVDDAGSKVGLGDFRPARKGPFGRFKVVNWKKKK